VFFPGQAKPNTFSRKKDCLFFMKRECLKKYRDRAECNSAIGPMGPPNSKSPQFNTRNSTVELGQQPLNSGKNALSPAPIPGLTYPQYPSKSPGIWPRQASDKPRHTKKFNRAVELERGGKSSSLVLWQNVLAKSVENVPPIPYCPPRRPSVAVPGTEPL
jgi:hypothetical protein